MIDLYLGQVKQQRSCRNGAENCKSDSSGSRATSQAFVEHLEESGHLVTVIDGIGVDAVSVSRTSEAMKAGAEIIAQGALEADGWMAAPIFFGELKRQANLGLGLMI